ncbi:hypothetical protein [Phormidium nigroviride]
MTNRWDETFHRLREWTNGQAPSERLAAQILLHEDYQDLDPSHPLGGRDGTKDAVCKKNGKEWLMAVYFPRGQQNFGNIKKKFHDDLKGVKSNKADALAFVTNQELLLSEREELRQAAQPIPVELFHLERITAILDKPEMNGVRKQFLQIDFKDEPSQKTVYNQTIYNQQASEFFDEVKNSVRTTYRRNPITGVREILGTELP